MEIRLGEFRIVLTRITYGIGLFVVLGRYQINLQLEGFKDKTYRK